MRASTPPPKTHHIDKRAHQIVDVEGATNEDLLTTPALAEWLAVSTQWLEMGRLRGYGPPFTRIGPNSIRYRRGDVRAWLAERRHHRTSEYEHYQHGPGRPARKRAKRGGS
jgi:predicted DNA-binding transcriptional regulator AlpA